MKLHTEEKQHKCEKCNVSFETNHCDHCHFRFSEKRELINNNGEHHVIEEIDAAVNDQHEPESEKTDGNMINEPIPSKKPSECDQYDEVFVHKSLLIVHKTIQNGEVPCKCD